MSAAVVNDSDVEPDATARALMDADGENVSDDAPETAPIAEMLAVGVNVRDVEPDIRAGASVSVPESEKVRDDAPFKTPIPTREAAVVKVSELVPLIGDRPCCSCPAIGAPAMGKKPNMAYPLMAQ